MALEDTLTGLANRGFFQGRLEAAIANADRTGRCFGLMLLDLDHFKLVNDTLGHPAGDELLRQVSRRLFNCVRVTDTVARLGVDEFAVIATNLEAENGIITLAQRIVQALTKPFNVNEQEIHTGTSIGITVFPSDKGTPEQLMRNADLALYRAKDAGRGSFELFDEQMNAAIQARRAMERDLRAALENQEFHVVYQPQFDIRSGDLIGAEALIRWTHSERGPISPAEFIPLAELTRLIIPISEWVLKTVCHQVKRWLEDGLASICVSVNMSPLHFKQTELVAQLTDILAGADLDARWLELEITEGIAMEAGDDTLDILTRLKTMGFKLSIDDFGTGFSSLDRLKKFPVDRIKIDQSFVRDITTDVNDAAISTAVVRLGHSLNLKVIAEGVETVEQLAFLAEQGCDEMQGYLLSEPLKPGEFETFMRTYDPVRFPIAEELPCASARA